MLMGLKFNPQFNAKLSGCTLNGVVIDFEQNKVYSFNLGDSRCILIKENKKFKALSRDHKVDLEDEQARIHKMGGEIGQTVDEFGNLYGPLRIFNKSFTQPGLAFTRSLGDQFAHQLGCTEIPEIWCHELTKSDKKIVIATDGVWDVFSNEEISSINDN